MTVEKNQKTKRFKHKLAWLLWSGLSLFFIAIMSYEILSDSPEDFSPGHLTSAHHQIELSCAACHSENFGGLEAIDKTCQDCHNSQLNAQKDSHPAKKFTDPRNADRLEEINALSCVACHSEHHVDRDVGMAVTVQNDFCIKCHAEVDEERPTHKGFDTMTCATAGCHNYHDNSALYENFLMKHIDEPEIAEKPRVDLKNAEMWMLLLQEEVSALTASDMDSPKELKVDGKVVHEWSEASHAQAGVNCQDCHSAITKKNPTGEWQEALGTEVCQTCHAGEVTGFLAGKHGMREGFGLPPMQVGQARLSMSPLSHDKTMSCNSCHKAHQYDVQQASVNACLNCHSDEHSTNYRSSKHFMLWLNEQSDTTLSGTGVSCATCHMPRVVVDASESTSGVAEVRVEHNQSLYLRPNEKMIKSVCLSCHGLQFTLDSLADEALINNNFSGQPKEKIKSLDWAIEAGGGQ